MNNPRKRELPEQQIGKNDNKDVLTKHEIESKRKLFDDDDYDEEADLQEQEHYLHPNAIDSREPKNEWTEDEDQDEDRGFYEDTRAKGTVRRPKGD